MSAIIVRRNALSGDPVVVAVIENDQKRSVAACVKQWVGTSGIDPTGLFGERVAIEEWK